MDGLSALGAAAAIAQFIDLGFKLVSKSVEIHSSTKGITQENSELSDATTSLSSLCQRLDATKATVGVKNRDELAIQQLAQQCAGVATELSTALLSAKATGPRTWESARAALRGVWKEREIQDIEKRLLRFQKQLHIHLSAAILNKHSDLASRLRDLSDEHQRRHISTDDKIQDLTNAILQALRQAPTEPSIIQAPLDSSQRNGHLGQSDKVSRRHKLLQWLHFPDMFQRPESVAKKHPNTFEWIHDQHHDGQELHFSRWLQSRGGIFWIMGKAGSGKSTLMKWLVDDQQTLASLKDGSSQRKVVAKYFFWNAGSTLQKSQQGLARTLLFEILRQQPELIDNVSLKKGCFSQDVDGAFLSAVSSYVPKLDELYRILEDVLKNGQGHLQFFLFIDGLDEYAGANRELAEAIQRFSDFPNVKICLASRLRSEFQEYFGNVESAKLILHDHTKGDIRLYVHEILEKDKFFQRLKADDSRYQSVVDELVEKAQGVFLWIFLVVRDIRNNLLARDSIDELQELVRSFPPDLDEFFLHMLDSIDARHQQTSSRALLMCLAAIGPLPLLTVHLALDKTPADSALPKCDSNEPDLVADKLLEHAEVRIGARCMDLIDVKAHASNAAVADAVNMSIILIHRTVYDFLRREVVQDRLIAWSGAVFDPEHFIS